MASVFEEWLRKRRQNPVEMMGTVESGDFGARPFYTTPTGTGDLGPALNEKEYSRLEKIVNPVTPVASTSVLPPGPGTAAREEGMESVRLAAQGVPKVTASALEQAPAEMSTPHVFSGKAWTPATGPGSELENAYYRQHMMAGAVDRAGTPYWEKTKEGYKPVFMPEAATESALSLYSGGIEGGVNKLLSEADKLRAEGDEASAGALEKTALSRLRGTQADWYPKEAAAEIGLKGRMGQHYGALAEKAGTENKLTIQMHKELGALDLAESKAKADFMKTLKIPPGETGWWTKVDNKTKQAWSAIEQEYGAKRKSTLERYGIGGIPSGTQGEVTATKKVNGKTYVQIDGQWYEQ